MERVGLSCVQSASWVEVVCSRRIWGAGSKEGVLQDCVCCDGLGLCAQEGLVSRALELLGAGLSSPSVNFSLATSMWVCSGVPGTGSPRAGCSLALVHELLVSTLIPAAGSPPCAVHCERLAEHHLALLFVGA